VAPAFRSPGRCWSVERVGRFVPCSRCRRLLPIAVTVARCQVRDLCSLPATSFPCNEMTAKQGGFPEITPETGSRLLPEIGWLVLVVPIGRSAKCQTPPLVWRWTRKAVQKLLTPSVGSNSRVTGHCSASTSVTAVG